MSDQKTAIIRGYQNLPWRYTQIKTDLLFVALDEHITMKGDNGDGKLGQ